MKKRLLLLLALFFTPACSRFGPSTPSADMIATQVAEALTAVYISQPTAAVVTQLVTLPVTVTPPAITETETPLPTDTATPTPDMSATPGPTATPSLTPTTQILPTVTLPASDPRSHLGAPTLFDDMNGTNKIFYWYTYVDENNSSFQIEDGHLVMTDYKRGANWVFSSEHARNFYVDFTYNIDTCAGSDSYGIIFRAPDNDNGYLVGLTCDGRYSLRRWDAAQKKIIDIIPWTESDAIVKASGQTNRLGIMADGAHLGVYINSKLVNEASNNTYLEGKFGPYINAAVTSGLTVRISEVSYWKLN